MQSVVMPYGNTNVLGIKSFDIGDNRKNVTIVNRLSERRCVLDFLLGNLAELLPANIVFHQADSRNVFWIHGQHTVF